MERLLEIINTVRVNKNQPPLIEIKLNQDLRTDIGFDSMDLAEMTVRIESVFLVDVFDNGYVLTIGDIAKKLSL